MSTKHTLTTLPLTAILTVLVGAAGARAATVVPIKEITASHFGREVNLTEVEKHAGPSFEDVCSVQSGDTCQAGRESSIAGGFAYPQGVAVQDDPASPDYGDVYVADTVNARVQELTPSGTFVSMFGGEVNETKDNAVKAKGGTPTQTEREEENVCSAASGDVCKTGVKGGAAEQFGEGVESVAVDPATGNVYVADDDGTRVDEYTSSGQFVLRIGREVNETTKGNVCTAASKDVCKAGVRGAGESSEHSAFNFAEGAGDLLAVGGPEHLLYVGDQHRVQEFDPASGEWKGEISLTSIFSEPDFRVDALAVDDSCSLQNPVLTESTTPTCKEFDPEYGDVYLVYGGIRAQGDADVGVNILRKFTAGGVEVDAGRFPLTLSPKESRTSFIIRAIALDANRRLALSTVEEGVVNPLGLLYEAATGRLVTEFASPPGYGAYGLAFGVGGEPSLYAAALGDQEVVSYAPVDVAELSAGVTPCSTGPEHESDVTFGCVLHGEANPEGVSETQAWFQWGTSTTLGSETPKDGVTTGSALEPLPGATIEGLKPNQTVYYRVAGEDHNVKAPEAPLSSETVSVLTPTVPARIVGTPSVSFVRSASAVLFGELNPEHARSESFFEYAAGEALAKCPGGVRRESCAGVASTGVLESAAYGKIGATLEATGLVAGAVYHYRLAAVSENSAKTEKQESRGAEGSFTTTSAPVPTAVTGGPSGVGATSATIAGAVDPDGQPATYAFELGVYTGAGTQYGVVFSGPAGAGTTPAQESLGLTGLQPGTTYAYRVSVKSGYGTVTGEAVLFTTTGLPSVLEVPLPLPLLLVPSIAFPVETTGVRGTGALTEAQKLEKALKACGRKPRKKRAGCERRARRKYGPVRKRTKA